MAIQNFIPTIWEARLMAKFHERAIVDMITTPPTRIEGEKIIFNKVSDVAVHDYTGEVDFGDLELSKVELPMDQKKYFAFKVDDVDKVQAAGELIDPHIEEAAYKLQEAADKFVLGKAMAAATAVDGVSSVYDAIVACNTKLNKNKVPKADRFAVVNAEALEDLHTDARFTAVYEILENGVIEGAKINGVQLIFSEELNNGVEAACVMHKSAIGYGQQLKETEALRLETAFADGVRGLEIYGAAVLRPEAIAKYSKQ